MWRKSGQTIKGSGDMTEYSENAQRLIDALTGDELRQIKKENPFRGERNNLICDLRGRGVRLVALAEVSGMSGTAISKILAKTPHSSRYEPAKGA